MIRTYIFNEENDNWLEEDQILLLHDLCALLDEDKKMMYLWNGPKSSKERVQKGTESLSDIINIYPEDSIKLIVLKEKIPTNIQAHLDALLETIKKDAEKKNVKFTKLTTIRLYFYFSLIGNILPIISLLIISSCFFWPSSGGVFEVSASAYELWLTIPKFLILISFLINIPILIVGLIEQDNQVIVYSIMGILIYGGIFFYLNQGIFLFLFQLGHTSGKYLVSLVDLIIFYLLLLIPMLVLLIPNGKKFNSFFKTYKQYISLDIKKELKENDEKLKKLDEEMEKKEKKEKIREDLDKVKETREKAKEARKKAKEARKFAKKSREDLKKDQKKIKEKEGVSKKGEDLAKEKEVKAKLKAKQDKIKEKEQAIRKEEKIKEKEAKAKIKAEQDKIKEKEKAKEKEAKAKKKAEQDKIKEKEQAKRREEKAKEKEAKAKKKAEQDKIKEKEQAIKNGEQKKLGEDSKKK